MAKKENKFISLILRYLLLIILSLGNMRVFYFIFTPLTIYGSYFLLNFFLGASLLSSDTILIKNIFPIEIIDACVAGAAYYLLTILNFSTPNIKIKKRLLILGESFFILLVLNILRIFFVGFILIKYPSSFEIVHKFFWYLMSIIFVVGIWFFLVKHFKIKEIPLYSDAIFLYKKSIFSKK